MVVAEGVVDRAVDSHQLVPMLEETRENLGQVADETVADKGYRTDRAIGEAVERKYSVLVQLYESEGEEASRYHPSRFRYDGEQDCCICPEGYRLDYSGQRRSRHGYLERRYRCGRWKSCPEARRCSASQRGRVIHVGPYWQQVDEQRRRQKLPEEKEKLRRRKTIVEPVFAHLKQNLGFRRWSFWGLDAAAAQWSLLCTAYNLKKLLQVWQGGQFRMAN